LDALLAGKGASIRAIGARFGLSYHAVARHARNHLPAERRAALLAGPARVAELTNLAAEESKSVLEYLALARGIFLNQLLDAAELRDKTSVATIGGRLLENLKAIASITGELRNAAGLTINSTTNIAIMSDPRFIELQAGLVKIAREYPDARRAILTLLQDLDAKVASPILSNAPLIDAECSDAA
jgi:hypothetical protein